MASGARILLAEDEAAAARPVISTLASRGHDVRWVRAVREIRSALPAFHPQMLLLDVTLDTDGLEFFQAIRFAADCPPAGVVILTEPGDIPARERANQLGAAAVMSKPLDVDALATVVDELLTYI
jgi:two-component system CheB/CheR fusion protein